MKTATWILAGLVMAVPAAAAQDSPWGPGYNDFMRQPDAGVRRTPAAAPRPEVPLQAAPRIRRTMSDFGYRGVEAYGRTTSSGAPLYEVPLWRPPPASVPDYPDYAGRAYDAPAWLDAYRGGRRPAVPRY